MEGTMKQFLFCDASFKQITFVILFLAVTGCTSGSGSSSSNPLSSLITKIKGDSSSAVPKELGNQLNELQQKLNQDPSYQLTREDQDLLVSEGISDNGALKAWVK